MKILITSITYPGMIGVSTYIKQLIKGLKDKGHHVDLFSHNPFLQKRGMKNKNTNTITQIANYQAAAARLPLGNYDLIHSQGIIPTLAISRIKPKHIPLVISLHGALAFNQLFNGVNKRNTPLWKQSLRVESSAVSASDICIVGSQWLKNILLNEYKVPQSQQFAIVPYGMNIEEFSQKMQMPASIPKPANKYVLSCTARLVPLKGHRYLLNSLVKLKLHRKDWVCWMIGEGPLRKQLEQQAARLGLRGFVKFLGNQTNVASLLKSTDLFVFPSVYENFPYAVMEAQSAGIPLVVTNVGGIPEMVTHGQTGLVSPLKNSDSLFQNIKILLENAQLRESLAINAKNWAMVNLSIDTMINNTVAVYNKAIEMKK
ncbi:glycosyltransferase involved in cell wall biosynthesis [Cytobacillus oceanisediminis]|uniref:Glycosyltransferase involved in cell wall biosynthesis n=1 Tax=Cytobacillus oceanisediminis TaxID=665099 RepID=A0A2V3A5R8_9BACI|nr:glycosyltransferase family 4 protein [Cytobacillus oceanisediminis]PWW31908.1 glycosyltransferase involved in cell wall biosynthesis [Cytobacillus oceanisediminis]